MLLAAAFGLLAAGAWAQTPLNAGEILAKIDAAAAAPRDQDEALILQAAPAAERAQSRSGVKGAAGPLPVPGGPEGHQRAVPPGRLHLPVPAGLQEGKASPA
jgi:hypothetical protein